MKCFAYFAALCAFLQPQITLAAPEFNLDYTAQDNWGGICNKGHRQSPIDIGKANIEVDESLPELKIDNLGKEISFVALNTGFQAEFNFTGEDVPLLHGAGLDGTYILHNLYFHWPSEHTFNGRHYNLEGEYLAYSTNYSNIEEAVTKPEALLLLSVFYEVGENAEIYEAIDALANATRQVSKNVGDEVRGPSIVLPPINTQSLYTYKGSFPVPPCNENVIWILLQEPTYITQDQYDKLVTTYDNRGELVITNARKTQELNGRSVTYSLKFSGN